MVLTASLEMDPTLKATLLAQLREMRADQVLLKNLIPSGWTIPYLCDLLIEEMARPEGPTIPGSVLLELTTLLKPEWILARRSERAAYAVAETLQRLTTAIEGLPERIALALRPEASSARAWPPDGPPRRLAGFDTTAPPADTADDLPQDPRHKNLRRGRSTKADGL